ncbi:hypothetical protein [Methanobacterium sp.]|uniref:hypothetical protein n=1 Tax=Methanobacterium sp. TaxID=2164 RepID=UPI0031586C1E
MDRRLIVVFIFVIIGLAALTYGYTQQDQNKIQSSVIQNATQNSTTQNSEQKDVNGTLKDYDAIITQKGPSTPQKRGTSVSISYTVTNKGKNTIYNAKVGAQDFEKDVGTLNPGQTRKYTYSVYIPTNVELASWYSSDVKLTNTLEIGSIILTFIDDKGNSQGVRSNQISIKLLN